MKTEKESLELPNGQKLMKVHKKQNSSLNLSDSSIQTQSYKQSHFFMTNRTPRGDIPDNVFSQKNQISQKSRTVTVNFKEKNMQQEFYQQRMQTQDTQVFDQVDNMKFFALKKAQKADQELEQKMLQIKQNHGKIIKFVQNFEGYINTILQKQEGDFETAFRGHCFHVKNEIKTLKKTVLDLESMQKFNKTIQELRQQVDFYSNEAYGYSLLLEQTKKQNAILKARVDSMIQEKQYLERSLKQAKKQILFLQSSILSFQSNQQLCLTQSQTPHPPRSPTQFQLTSDKTETIQKQFEETEFMETQEQQSQSSSSTCPRSVHQRNSQIVQNQQKQLEVIQGKYKALLKSRTQAMMQKSDLEEVFLDCINEVKKQIARRKNVKIKEVNIKDLRTLDKQTLLELFLTNESVVIQIYESLFPHRAPQFSLEQNIQLDKSISKFGNSNGQNKAAQQIKTEPKPPDEKSEIYNNNKLLSPRAERGVFAFKTSK